jgi:hypothetical protein
LQRVNGRRWIAFRGVPIDRLRSVFVNGVDVDPTDGPIFCGDEEKAFECVRKLRSRYPPCRAYISPGPSTPDFGLAYIALAKAAGKYKGRKAALSKIRAEELRARMAQGESVSALAQEYGVSRQTVYNYAAHIN